MRKLTGKRSAHHRVAQDGASIRPGFHDDPDGDGHDQSKPGTFLKLRQAAAHIREFDNGEDERRQACLPQRPLPDLPRHAKEENRGEQHAKADREAIGVRQAAG